MPFAIFKGEKTIDDLVTRLFPPQGRSSKTTAKQIATALLKANPLLKQLSNVPAGSILVIPDTAPKLAAAEQVAAPAQVLSAGAALAQQLANTLAERLDAIDVRALDAAQSLLGLAAQSRKLPREGSDLQELSTAFPFSGQAPKARLKDLETSRKARAEAFAILQQQIGSWGKQ
jgi:phage tail protein X